MGIGRFGCERAHSALRLCVRKASLSPIDNSFNSQLFLLLFSIFFSGCGWGGSRQGVSFNSILVINNKIYIYVRGEVGKMRLCEMGANEKTIEAG